MSLDKIKESKIYDINGKLVFELLEKEISLNRDTKVLISLLNIDTNKVIIEILKENINSFIKGIEVIKEIVSTNDTLVILPLETHQLTEELKSKEINVINENFIKPNDYKEYLQLNINTVVNIGKVSSDNYNNEIGIFVKNGEKLEFSCFNTENTFGDIFNDYSSLIGLQVGYKYYDKSIFSQKLTLDFDYGDFVITPIMDNICIVSETKKELMKTASISCGNCLFCREGLIHLNVYIDNIVNNKSSLTELGFIEEIGKAMKTNNLCSIGNKGSELALSAIEVFADVYKEHIKDKICSTYVCKSFSTIYIDPKLCTGCEECSEICPVGCIDGKNGYIHMIDEFECNRCGKCIEICEEAAILKSEGKLPKLPRKLTKVGKFK